jgi:Icc-related predicted phosphoesterase
MGKSMRVKVVSDLHLEFLDYFSYKAVLESIAEGSFDVLVMAGDICSKVDILEDICNRFRGKEIVYVLGNHEFYGETRDRVLWRVRGVADKCPWLHVLENETVTLGGIRFVGCTLWFRHAPYPEFGDLNLSDFSQIKDIYSWIYPVAEGSFSYLKETVKKGDFVVTHHLPHPGSIHRRYFGNPLNRYFLHDIRDIVELQEASYWAHGHTHDSFSYIARKTMVVCNPAGYQGENIHFNPGFCVEVDPVDLTTGPK